MKIEKLIKNLDNQITVRDMINLLGGTVHNYPVIGDCITINGNRHCVNNLTDTDEVAISYTWTGDTIDVQKLTAICIGTKYTGIMLSCREENGSWVWRNCYSHGNYGKNYSEGGSWASDAKRTYATAAAALADRDYIATGITVNNRYTEGKACADLILSFLAGVL